MGMGLESLGGVEAGPDLCHVEDYWLDRVLRGEAAGDQKRGVWLDVLSLEALPGSPLARGLEGEPRS